MRRQAFRYGWLILLMAAVGLGTIGPASAADRKASDPVASPAQDEKKSSDVPSLEPDSARTKPAKTSKRDSATMAALSAFAVPRGTELSAKQKEALKKLKSDMEPKLRADVEDLEKAADGAEKRAAATKLKETKKEIAAAIQKIVDMAAEDAAKQQADAMRQAQKAEAQRRAMQNQKHRIPYPAR